MPVQLPIRQAIIGQVRKLVGGTGDDRIERSCADTGLLNLESAFWKVHGDFTSTIVGGIAALFVQMLHPRALAGVWDHFNFRHDMLGPFSAPPGYRRDDLRRCG